MTAAPVFSAIQSGLARWSFTFGGGNWHEIGANPPKSKSCPEAIEQTLACKEPDYNIALYCFLSGFYAVPCAECHFDCLDLLVMFWLSLFPRNSFLSKVDDRKEANMRPRAASCGG